MGGTGIVPDSSATHVPGSAAHDFSGRFSFSMAPRQVADVTGRPSGRSVVRVVTPIAMRIRNAMGGQCSVCVLPSCSTVGTRGRSTM